jgi:hypothetical protein
VLALVLDEALFRFAATLLFCVPPLGPVTAVLALVAPGAVAAVLFTVVVLPLDPVTDALAELPALTCAPA